MQIDKLAPAACAKSTKRCNSLSDCALGSEGCAEGFCYPIANGCPCVDDSGCPQPGSHCGGGRCYPDAQGAACDGDNAGECGLGTDLHCSEGLCYPNKTGAPCASPLDCGLSSACVDGVCN